MEIQYLQDIDEFPTGYKFSPTDEELIVEYLSKKVRNERLPPNRIYEVQLYNVHPQKLAEKFRPSEGDVWYFFTSRTRRYKNGSRPSRAAGDGYWKATGGDNPIRNSRGVEVGSKNSLVYFEGAPSQGTKTNWLMQEYKVKDPPVIERRPNDNTLDTWVLCQVYYKGDRAANVIDSPAYQSTTGYGFVASIDIQNTSLMNRNSWQYKAMFKDAEADS